MHRPALMTGKASHTGFGFCRLAASEAPVLLHCIVYTTQSVLHFFLAMHPNALSLFSAEY